MSYKNVQNNYDRYGNHTSTTYRYGCNNGTKIIYTHPTGRSNYKHSSHSSSKRYK